MTQDRTHNISALLPGYFVLPDGRVVAEEEHDDFINPRTTKLSALDRWHYGYFLIKRFALSATEAHVLLCILYHAGTKPECIAWPKRATIASFTGISMRSVAYALNSLEKRGLIKRHRQRFTTVYEYMHPDEFSGDAMPRFLIQEQSSPTE